MRLRLLCQIMGGIGSSIDTRNLLPELDNFPFHLGVSAAFPNPLEIRLNFAIEF